MIMIVIMIIVTATVLLICRSSNSNSNSNSKAVKNCVCLSVIEMLVVKHSLTITSTLLVLMPYCFPGLRRIISMSEVAPCSMSLATHF